MRLKKHSSNAQQMGIAAVCKLKTQTTFWRFLLDNYSLPCASIFLRHFGLGVCLFVL